MLAVSSLDSMIRIYNIDEGNVVNQIATKPSKESIISNLSGKLESDV